nr:PDZ domain-containing protein [Corynebacterium sp. CCUG 70398]
MPATADQPAPSVKRRRAAVVWGGIPLAVAAALFVAGGIPGTDIRFTVPFAAQGPGPTFNTLEEVDGTPVIEIEGADVDPTAGSLDMTTVSVRTNMTVGQALSRWLISDDTLVPINQIMPANMSDEEMRKHNEATFVASEAAATVAAMRYLGEPTRVLIHDVLEDGAAADALKPEDIITAVDGTDVSAPQEVQDLVRSKNPGDELTISYERDGEPGEATITLGTNPQDESVPLLGVTMSSEPTGDVAVNYNFNDVGGPSAGMIFSLAVIDKLSPGELNGGKHVAGTGTISEDGSVGPIGGITHKIEGARDGGAELFLAPENNCKEASKVDAGDMVVASVATLDDAVAAMSAFSEGSPVKTCAAD